MALSTPMFAFVVGEVAPEFYGRTDLTKYPLGMAMVENFIVDYKGGLLNRAGTELIAALPVQYRRFVRFRSIGDDYELFFTNNKMRVIRNGGFILTGAVSSGESFGVISEINTFVGGELLFVNSAGQTGYYIVTNPTGTTYELKTVFGGTFVGTGTWQRVFEYATPFTDADLAQMSFRQDESRIVCTSQTLAQRAIEYVADDNWTTVLMGKNLPDAPLSLATTPSGAGAASYAYAVTAVVNGVESSSSIRSVEDNAINFNATTGNVAISWLAVTDAEYYNIYRSLVFPTSPFPAGAQLGYIGRTTGLSYSDGNITPDFTKSPPKQTDYFAGGNNPAVYARFQQRGIYAGLAKEPLAVIGSGALSREQFYLNTPGDAGDSFKYTLDSESVRPIKSMLPLRYGLLLFTDDQVVQLRGANNSTALTALSAVAEPQSYVTVADLPPIAINLDVLFMTALFSELNAMVYTEYTNSFKTEDIAVLSSHLFGVDHKVVSWDWAPEPHKILHFVREDGQRVSLTYERNQQVFGFARHRTKGKYLDLNVVRESNYNVVYCAVERYIRGQQVMMIEREKPRQHTGYNRTWFVDCGLERPMLPGTGDGYLRCLTQGTQTTTGKWEFTPDAGIGFAVEDMRLYINNGLFKVTTFGAGVIQLDELDAPAIDEYFDENVLRIAEASWSYNTVTSAIEGLWHLEGQTVSVQADGEAYKNLTVADGRVEFDNPAARVVVGLPYRSRAKTLPLTSQQYQLAGKVIALRDITVRQRLTRGLAIGHSFDAMNEIPAARFEPWGNPFKPYDELTSGSLFGGAGWEFDPAICIEQSYPLPAGVLGLSFDLDPGS